MIKTLDFLNGKDAEYMKRDLQSQMYHTIPNYEIAKWMDELVDIRIRERITPGIKKQLTKIIKDGTFDICPNCNEPTKVYANPMYMHTCVNCGWEGDYRSCTFSYPEDRIIKLFTDV